jgi:hypothetical protein
MVSLSNEKSILYSKVNDGSWAENLNGVFVSKTPLMNLSNDPELPSTIVKLPPNKNFLNRVADPLKES